MLQLCDVLMARADSSPVHSEYVPRCLMRHLHDWWVGNATAGTLTGNAWPIASLDFNDELLRFLYSAGGTPFRSDVGFHPDGSGRMAWMSVVLRSQYEDDAKKTMARPADMRQYRAAWAAWFDELPAQVWAAATPAVAAALPPVEQSVTASGWPICRSWEALPTLQATHSQGGATAV